MYYLVRTPNARRWKYWTNKTSRIDTPEPISFPTYRQASNRSRMMYEEAVLFKLNLQARGASSSSTIIPAMWIPPVGELFIGRNYKL